MVNKSFCIWSFVSLGNMIHLIIKYIQHITYLEAGQTCLIYSAYTVFYVVKPVSKSLCIHWLSRKVLSPSFALSSLFYMLVNVVSPQWELHKAGWEKSAMAQLHKWAFYWANQSGSPRFGPLPRKHSLEGVSPYPCAWAERSQYYHYPALTLSPPLSFFLCFLLMLFLVSSSRSCSTLLPSSFLFFALACILHFSLPSHALLFFTHSPAKQIAIRKL